RALPGRLLHGRQGGLPPPPRRRGPHRRRVRPGGRASPPDVAGGQAPAGVPRGGRLLPERGGPVPEVIAVCPLHNHARWVAEALDSLAAQTVRPSRVVVVDDGSTDGGGALVRELSG